MITRDEIRQKVSTNPNWASRALVALLERQTQDEQSDKVTRHSNGVGFNGVDAEILTSFAQQVQKGRTLSEKQLAIAYKKLPKYSAQLEEISQNKAGAE